MIRELRLAILALATSSLLSLSLMADTSVDTADESELNLEDASGIDFFYGQGWYAGLAPADSRFCNLPVNAGLPMCLTGLVAPVLTLPGFPNWGRGGHHRHHGGRDRR